MRVRSVGLSASLFVGLLGCQLGPPPLAVVGDHEVTLEQLNEAVYASTGKQLGEVSPELAAALFENLLEEEVLLSASPDPADRRRPISARSARARELLGVLCPPPAELLEAEVDAYLAQHPEELVAVERVRLRQLILPDLAGAQAARDRLRAGARFDEVSRELSRAPNAAEGGMIGWVERAQLPPKFEAAVLPLGPGEISEPVESNAGWHLFQVIDRRETGSAADPDLRARVRQQLSAAAADQLRLECLVSLATRVGVVVDCRAAGFECRNPFEDQS